VTDTKIETTPEHIPYPFVNPMDVWGKTIAADLAWTRDTYWQSQHGELVKVRHLKDTHLANILVWVENNPRYEAEFVKVLKDETVLRGLSPEFLGRAMIPYRHDNKWMLTVDPTSLDRVVG
jgi:hypothetical protein